MVNFELSELLQDTDLTTSLDEIKELASKISIQTSEYINRTKNQTTGMTNTSGNQIINLPQSDKTGFFINDSQSKIQKLNEQLFPELCCNTVWQIMMATQTLPMGWLYNNVKFSDYKYEKLHETWNRIILGTQKARPLYYRMNAFGLVSLMIGGHKNANLVFYAIYDNEHDKSYLESYISANEIGNLILMSEQEFANNLFDGMYYTFLIKFDKVNSPYTGVTFKARTKLIESVPSYNLEIGCSNAAVLIKDADNEISNPHMNFIDFKRGSTVTIPVRIPTNYVIYMVALNGSTYFRNSIEMESAGITITETNLYSLDGYKSYNVTVSKLISDSKIFIGACEDRSTITTNSMISGSSTLTVTSENATLNILFTRPFIYLNPAKVKVWARKTEDTGETLITNASLIVNGSAYIERKAVFASDSSNVAGRTVKTSKAPFWCGPCGLEKPHTHHECNALETDTTLYIKEHHKSPYVHYSCPSNGAVYNNEVHMTSECMLYGVSECGSLVIMFDGYANYQEFRLEIEPEAMVAVIKTPNGTDTDYIPYIEEKIFENPYWDKIIDDDDPDGVNNDGYSDNNTKPDIALGPNLGISYDAD